VIPATRAENLVIAGQEPLIGRLARGNSKQRLLALVTPGIRPRSVAVIAPIKTDLLASIDGVRDVRADQGEALPTVSFADHFARHGWALRLHEWKLLRERSRATILLMPRFDHRGRFNHLRNRLMPTPLDCGVA
jgi:hypothetical protein